MSVRVHGHSCKCRMCWVDREGIMECDMPEALRGLVPSVGSEWWWEPEKPHARESVVVTSTRWNGEEVWVEAEGLNGKRYWNDLGRWVEATVLRRPPVSSSQENPDG